MLCLNFEVARQAWSTSLCGPVQAVPRADDCQQELARLAPSVCELKEGVKRDFSRSSII